MSAPPGTPVVVDQRDDDVRVAWCVVVAGCRCGAPCADAGRRRQHRQADLGARGIHQLEEGADAVLRVVQVGAGRVLRAVGELAHRSGAVEHDHHVQRLGTAGRACGCRRLHVDLVEAEQPQERRLDVRRLRHGHGVRRTAAREHRGAGGLHVGAHGAHVRDWVLAATAVRVRGGARRCRVGQVGRTGQGGGVGRRAQRHAGAVRLGDIDDEAQHHQQSKHEHDDEGQNLPAFTHDRTTPHTSASKPAPASGAISTKCLAVMERPIPDGWSLSRTTKLRSHWVVCNPLRSGSAKSTQKGEGPRGGYALM